MGADHDEDPHELAYIIHIGERLGLSDDDLKEVSYNIDGYELQPPVRQKDRITILYYFLFLMKADGVIKAEEEEFICEFGLKLGFKSEMITDLVEVIKQYLDSPVPPEELYSKVRSHIA